MTPMRPDARVGALDGLLEEAGLDAVLATKDASIAYLTGFWGVQLERFFGVAIKRGGAGALVAPDRGRRQRPRVLQPVPAWRLPHGAAHPVRLARRGPARQPERSRAGAGRRRLRG